jgi:hypothetical protein
MNLSTNSYCTIHGHYVGNEATCAVGFWNVPRLEVIRAPNHILFCGKVASQPFRSHITYGAKVSIHLETR